jgi:Leucine-rich repeat (LRR) protein
MTYKPWTHHMAHKRIKEVSTYRRHCLVLERLGLTELPDELFELTHLDELIIMDNLLESIPLELTKLRSLTRLCLFYNEISAIPPEIGDLTNLTHLDVSCNKLETLPNEIKKLKNLVHLDLRFNNLPIPKEVLEQVDRPDLILEAYFEQAVIKA